MVGTGEIGQILVHDILVLFAMVNAIGNLPIFADLTAELAPRLKRRVFSAAVLTGGSIVIAFAFFGNWMLQSLFEVDTSAFKIAGGLLIFFVAARGMILGAPQSLLGPPDLQGNIGVFPLGFPYLAGPGTIVTSILLMQRGGPWITALAALCVYASVLPILYLAPLIHRVGGRVGILVVSRILHIFIASKAVAFVITGVRSYITPV